MTDEELIAKLRDWSKSFGITLAQAAILIASADRLAAANARIATEEAANQILASERDTYKRLLGEEIEIAVERA